MRKLPLDIQRKSMKELPKRTAAYICNCEKRCRYYVEMDSYGRFCAKDAVRIAELLRVLCLERTLWTLEEEETIKEWYYSTPKQTNGKVRRGSRTELAQKLDRTYAETSDKIDNMLKHGELKRYESNSV